MDDVLARNWGFVALRGVVALLFGVATLYNPALTLVVLVFLFGAYSFIDGIFSVVTAIANRGGQPYRIALLLGGIVGIAIGAVTYFTPNVTALALLFLIAAWAIVTGIAQIVAAIRLRKMISGEWLLALAGVLSVLFGVFLAAAPGAGALAVTLWIGAYAILFGILLIALAFRLRSWQHGHPTGAVPHAA